MTKNASKPSYNVIVLNHEILSLPEMKGICNAGDKVKCLTSKISVKMILNKRVKFMKVENENHVSFHLPLFVLGFSPEQKNDLILRVKRIEQSDFEKIPSHL